MAEFIPAFMLGGERVTAHDGLGFLLTLSAEETLERKRSHIKNVPLSSLSGIQKPGTPAGLN
jgi:hypothetical protein